jgi:diacylglycerol kinase family enzyme
MNLSPKKVAVILNVNARRVNERVKRKLASFLPADSIFATKDVGEAKKAVQAILEKKFDLVFCGGGDGTIVTTISIIRELLDAGGRYDVPPIGILKMGTGNAWAWAVDMDAGLDQLSRLAAGGAFSVARYDLIRVGELLCPMAGLGWDARILNDYYEINKKFVHTPLRPLMAGIFGYFFASAVRSIPDVMREKELPEVQVTLTGNTLVGVSQGGELYPIERGQGEIVYRGPASMVAAGTIPYFGYKIRAFPHAERKQRSMHLRITHVSAGEAVKNLRGIWQGRYASEKIIDFLTDGVKLTFDREMPLEVGGDPMGYTSEVEFSVPDFTVDIVSFRKE